MGGIESGKIRKMVRTLEKALPYASHAGALVMREIRIEDARHGCGSSHCHAGWYLIARHIDGGLPSDGRLWNTSYSLGIDAMADDLGAVSSRELVSWAADNPAVWGNPYGRRMFDWEGAFTPGGKERAETLKDICDHWLEVADRLEEVLNG